MSRETALICAYILDGKGRGHPISWPEIETWKPEDGLLWVHLNYTFERSQHWLKTKSGLDPTTRQALIAEETRPRSLSEENSALLCLRAVNLNPGQDPEDMVSIRILLEQNRIITTRKRKLLSVHDIRNSLESGVGAKTPGEFLVQLNDCIVNRISNAIEQLSDDVDTLEEEMITAESYKLRSKITEIRRQTILTKRYLSPQREALFQILHEGCKLFSKRDILNLREATDKIVRSVEELDSARERASIVHEELTSRLAEQMDKRMYLLSLVALIFLPLSFITGLLGINVGGIPGTEYKWAFTIICIMLLLIGSAMIYWLRKSKWI